MTASDTNRYEQILEAFSEKTDGYTAALAKASRAARLASTGRDERTAAIETVAAGVAAPMLISFVLWILREAKAAGIMRLYFLSRDGQVLLEIARKLVARFDLDIECSYLFASRAAYARAFENDRTSGWYFRDLNKETSAREILERLNAAEAPILDALQASAFGKRDPDRPLDEAGLEALSTFLFSSRFADLHADTRARERRCVLDYLSKARVFADGRVGIVDIGWRGTLHEMICLFAEEHGSEAPQGYHFGLQASDHRFQDRAHAFFYDNNRKTGLPNPLGGKTLFFLAEMFCCADHGTVTGFQRVDGEVVPMLEATWPESIGKWYFRDYRETLYRFADTVEIAPHHDPTLSREAIASTVTAFWRRPTRPEAVAWGGFPWDGGQAGESGTISLAEPLTTSGLVTRLRRRGFAEFTWIEAALVQSPRWMSILHGGVTVPRKAFRKARRYLNPR